MDYLLDNLLLSASKWEDKAVQQCLAAAGAVFQLVFKCASHQSSQDSVIQWSGIGHYFLLVDFGHFRFSAPSPRVDRSCLPFFPSSHHHFKIQFLFVQFKEELVWNLNPFRDDVEGQNGLPFRRQREPKMINLSSFFSLSLNCCCAHDAHKLRFIFRSFTWWSLVC